MQRPGKILLHSLILFWLAACATTGASDNSSGPGLASTAVSAEIPRATPTSAPVGTIENPLVIALPPGSGADEARVEAGKAFAEQLSEVTGYTFVVVAPDSYLRLVQALGEGNAHVTVLSPYAYVLAFNLGYANAAFARLEAGERAYGAQFIARTDTGIESFFRTTTGENTAEAGAALSQLSGKKPCWSDEISLSGYAVPAGLLAYHGIVLQPAAIVQGQPTVVRAVYLGGICDFGATYIDARRFPALLDEFPGVTDEVGVIWQIPPVIPYDIMVTGRNLPPQITLAISDALFRLTGMQAGRQVLGPAYGAEDWERITDEFYEEFRTYINASGVDLESVIDQEP